MSNEGGDSRNEPEIDPEQRNSSQVLDEMVSDIISRKLSLFDIMKSLPRGDYFAFVQYMRLCLVVSRDERIREIFRNEVLERAAGADGGSNIEIAKQLSRKDSVRRFYKLVEEQNRALKEHEPFLTGDTFDTCIEQYKGLLSYVERVWCESCRLYRDANYPLAAFLGIVVIEEVGKLSRLPWDLMLYDLPRQPRLENPVDKNHRRKHFFGVVSGALINARLDRVLGKDVVRNVLHLAESDELEKIRQRCLYIDFLDQKVVTPREVIDDERARVLTVLAGELMAEVLGYFPWEFERMLDGVIAFERAIGMPESKIGRR